MPGPGRCFVATAAYGSPMASQVQELIKFRDNILKGLAYGRIAVLIYYKLSPRLACIIQNRPILRSLTRIVLIPFIAFAKTVNRRSQANGR